MSRESLEGAAAIMAVAGQLREMLDGDSEQRCDEYFARKDAAIAAMLAAAGPLPDRAAGALQAVIEKRESQVTNAVKMHGPLAKRRALWDLAFGDEAGPNIKFARMYHDLEEELVAGKHTRVKPKGRRSCDWRWITK